MAEKKLSKGMQDVIKQYKGKKKVQDALRKYFKAEKPKAKAKWLKVFKKELKEANDAIKASKHK